MNLIIDRNFRGIGRIKKSSGTSHRPTFNRINGLLTVLYERGELERLRQVRDGTVKALLLLDEYPLAQRGSLAAHSPRPSSGQGCVYVLHRRDSAEVKIGFSADVTARMRDLQVGNGGELEVIGIVRGTRKTERVLHERFAPYRKRGEWFEAAPEIIEWARGLGA